MANLSKAKREELIQKLHEITDFIKKNAKSENENSLVAFINEIESELSLKKYGLVFDIHSEDIEEGMKQKEPILVEDKSLSIDNGGTQNYLIEGDNLAALKLLEKTRKGLIDVIYIDPPYNTGNKDFVYNDQYVDREDKYRHSKWLSFMKKRLEIAQKLLSREGIIFVSIDDNELTPLNMLMMEIFGEANFIGILPRVTKKSGKQHSDNIAKNHDYVIAYTKDHTKSQFKGEEVADDAYSFTDEYVKERGPYKLNQTLDYDSLWYNPAMDFPIQIGDAVYYPGGSEEKHIDRHAGIHKSKDWVWRWSRAKFDFGKANGFVVIKPGKDRPRIYTKTYVNAKIDKDKNGEYFVRIVARESNMSSIALVDNEYSNDNAKKELGKIMDASAFDFPKPTSLIKKLLSLIDKEDITVLDFFAGSGTTGHAVLDFNAGFADRKCEFILVNNNDNNICRDITYRRIKTVIEKEKYAASLKYYKVDYVDVDGQQYFEYADKFLEHIKELVELENGIDLTNDRRIEIILDDEELRAYIDGVFQDNPCRTVYLGHHVLLSLADEKKLVARGVEIRRIPDYYYGELK